MRLLWVAPVVLCAACSGNSPTGPTGPSNPPPPTQTVTFSGHVTATNGGQPLAQQAVSYASQSGLTDASGGFSLTVQPQTGGALLSITGTGIVSRGLMFSAAASRAVSVDAIVLDGRFDPNFYRAFIRNGVDGSGTEALRRLTRAPVVYVRTVDDNGNPVDSATVQSVVDAVWSVGSMWTGGQFGIADVPRGTEDHAGQPGWLTIHWRDLAALHFCGQSPVGQDGGVILLSRESPNCGCPGTQMKAETVRHELGHAFGYWHTRNDGDLMSGNGSNNCDKMPSPRELYHAAIAYRRPVGNTDPDNDPTSTVNLAPARAY